MVFKISKLLNEMNMFDDALIRSIYTKYSRSNRFNFNKVIFFNRKRLLFSVSRPSSIVIRSFRTCYREVNLRMFWIASYSIHYGTVIAVLVSTISEASVKWEIKTKPLIIGEEVRLSCNANNCPPENTKKWLGGKNYDLLCQDNLSKDPFKYEMTSNGTNFDLEIKEFNFTDVNCEYTCACGFQQYTSMLTVNAQELLYPPRLQEKILTQNGDRFHIDLLMEAYPNPKCKLFFQNTVLSVNISVRSISDDAYFGMFEVAIQQTVEPPRSICKGNITLHCEVGTNEYPLHLQELDLCKERETTKVVLYICIGSVAGILSFLAFLFCIKYINAKLMKRNTECKKEKNPDLTYPCMVHLIEEQHNTGATDEGTPCNK